MNDNVPSVHEPNILIQNDCENEVQLALNKKEISELIRIIKKQKQIMRNQSRIIKKQNMRQTKLEKRLLTAERECKLRNKETKQCNYAKLLRKLQKIFNDDQIRVLQNNKRAQTWSNETIMKALQLRFSCGITGYEELRRQNLPLPGLRTL